MECSASVFWFQQSTKKSLFNFSWIAWSWRRKKIRRAKKTLTSAVVRIRREIQTTAVATRRENTHWQKKYARYSARQSSTCGHGYAYQLQKAGRKVCKAAAIIGANVSMCVLFQTESHITSETFSM